jgi:hypothetical protein
MNTIKSLAATILAVATLATGQARAADYFTTSAFLAHCDSPVDYHQVACSFYAAAIADAYRALALATYDPTSQYVSFAGICMPLQIGANEVIAFTREEAGGARGYSSLKLEAPASVTAFAGLRKAYPCPRQPRQGS